MSRGFFVNARWRLKQVVRPSYARLRRGLGNLVFERGDFEPTSDEAELEEFGLAHRERVPYRPSGWWFLRRALRERPVRPDDVFVDFGSGKGRVVYGAARHPFKRVVGVEIAPELNEVARRNIERNRSRLRCRDVELITADAVDYEVPDDMTIAYFFSPFVGDTFAAVLRNVIASLDRAPRTVTLIYACPVLESELVATGRFRLVARNGREGAISSIAIFESIES